MRERRVKIADVARHAGVSVAAVSRTINGSTHISEEMLGRVSRSIEELGYQPTPAAQNLRRQRTQNIALIVPSITNPFFPELVVSVHAEVHRRGYALLLVDAEQTQTDAETMRVIERRIADGVLLVGSMDAEECELDSPLHSSVPLIAFDRAPRDWATIVVQAENTRGAAEVVTHLVDEGHTRIAHIAGPPGLGVSDDRAHGYRATLRKRGLGLDGSLMVSGDFTEDSGYSRTQQLLASGVEFSAIFAANDLMAIGAMAALEEADIAVPDDIAVAGFDGIHLGRYVQPTLTTYAQPIRVMAKRGVELLFDAIDHASDSVLGQSASESCRTLRFSGELIIRESTRRH